jgi:hypothetical protein
MLIDFKERAWEGVEGVNLAQNRDKRRAVANTVIECLFPSNVWKFFGKLRNVYLLKTHPSPHTLLQESCNGLRDKEGETSEMLPITARRTD